MNTGTPHSRSDPVERELAGSMGSRGGADDRVGTPMPASDAPGPQEDRLFPLTDESLGGPVDANEFRLTLMALSLVQGVGDATITGLPQPNA